MVDLPFFIVGCPRSGTTLLRWMLEEHPRLAIPPESHWVVDLVSWDAPWTPARQEGALREILSHRKYRHWWLTDERVKCTVARRRPSSYAELVTSIYTAFAEREGKLRWGDKTPENVRQMDLLAGLFPDATFIHIIRDGREVAASLAEQAWSRGGVVNGARWWCECVSAGRAAGARLDPERYFELRLENLAHEPEENLRQVCSVLGETYDAKLLQYPRRIFETEPWRTEDRRSHRHLDKPPTPGLRDWTTDLSRRQQNTVQKICAPLLEELGYSTDRSAARPARLSLRGGAPGDVSGVEWAANGGLGEGLDVRVRAIPFPTRL
jgi:Sulfotransferase family